MGFRGGQVATVAAGSNVAVGGTATAPSIGTVEDNNAADVKPVGQAGAAGTSGKIPNSDHIHQGVTSLAAGAGVTVTGGDSNGHGALTVAAGATGPVASGPLMLMASAKWTQIATGTGTPAAVGINQTLIAFPFSIYNPATIKAISLRVGSFVAGSTIRLGIYSTVNGLPQALVADFGTVSAAANGYQDINPVPAPPALAGGLYYLAWVLLTPGAVPAVYTAASPSSSSQHFLANPALMLPTSVENPDGVAPTYVAHNALVPGALPATFVPTFPNSSLSENPANFTPAVALLAQ